MTSEVGRVEMRRPSRNTEMRSAMTNSSSSRWVMKTTATPDWRSRRTWRNNRSTSWAESEAVGSSMISTRTSSEIALAISTACCPPTVRPDAGSRGLTVMSRSVRRRSASAYIVPKSTSQPWSSCPMKMFSATLRSGKIDGSW